MSGLNIWAVVAAAAVAAGIWFAGFNMGANEQNSKLGQNFIQFAGEERSINLKQQVNLWSVIADERRTRRDMGDTCLRINEVSTEARGKLIEQLKVERATADAAMAEALRSMKELGDADGELVKDWRDGVIPPDITCGVFNGAGCAGVRAPAAGADDRAGVAVRDGS